MGSRLAALCSCLCLSGLASLLRRASGLPSGRLSVRVSRVATVSSECWEAWAVCAAPAARCCQSRSARSSASRNSSVSPACVGEWPRGERTARHAECEGCMASRARLLLQLPAQVAVDAAEVVEGAHQLALLRLQLLALQPHVVGRAAPGGRPQLKAQLADGRVRLLERAEQVLAARPMRQLHRRVHAFLGGRVQRGRATVRRGVPWCRVAGGAGSTLHDVTL